MTGTLGGALEARKIEAGEGHLTSEAEGDVEVEDRVLVIKRIRVRYQLSGCPADKRDAARRAHEHHASRCPVYRSIGGCIDITTTLEFSDS
ncbi:MAG: OsmC family protein [Chloroflexi bacterium]|nr:MAG: OsmC family protein [Chloroflexota bacterium]